MNQATPPEQYGHLLANAAVVPDGVQLDFQGDRCGKSYFIKRNCIGNWESWFYDWREGGWYDLRHSGFNRHEAIEVCNNHAITHRLLKFLPTKPKFKPTWGGWGMGAAAASAASAAASAAVGGLLAFRR